MKAEFPPDFPLNKMNKLFLNITLLVLLSALYIGSQARQTGLQCFVEGECLDSLIVDIVETNNSRQCLHHCQV